jgi:phosphosulfolactate synthase
MNPNFNLAWDLAVDMPEQNRIQKPRTSGITMVIDKGLGLNTTKDLLDMTADYIDFIKIAFGSSALYTTELLRKKIELVKSYGIHIYPGGTLFEIAAFQNKMPQFLQRAAELGFTYVEVSEGTIDLTPDQRVRYIRQARKSGFGVLSEIGKKDKAIHLDPHAAILQINADLENGAEKVIIEGRDSGKGVGIYDEDGKIRGELLGVLISGIGYIDKIIFEAPQTSQHNYLLTKIGPNVNLGNVQPEDVLSLESTRAGLRGDTLRNLIKISQR